MTDLATGEMNERVGLDSSPSPDAYQGRPGTWAYWGSLSFLGSPIDITHLLGPPPRRMLMEQGFDFPTLAAESSRSLYSARS